MSIRNLSCPVPANINPLQSNGFMFAVNKLPDISFFCQEATIPSLTLPQAEFATPLSNAHIPGDKLEFGQLDIVFMIDETMNNYKAIYDWMVGLGFPKSRAQYASYISSQKPVPQASDLQAGYSDGILKILNNFNNPIRTVTFHDIYPTSLGSIMLQSTTNDTTYLAGQATFLYTLFEIT